MMTNDPRVFLDVVHGWSNEGEPRYLCCFAQAVT
jgi:hypothetical protein